MLPASPNSNRLNFRSLQAFFMTGALLTVQMLSAGPAFAQETEQTQEWPGWLGETGTGAITDEGLIEVFPDAGATIAWRQPIGPGYCGPAVHKGHIFVMDRTDEEGKGISVENGNNALGGVEGGERILCLNVETGEELWSKNYECKYTIEYPTGPRCTPTCDGDQVYTLGAMGDLICFNASDGTIVWQKKLTEEYGVKPPFWGYASSPVVDGDKLLVPVGGKESGAGVVAFNKATGEEIWKSVTTNDVAYSPLVIHEENEVRQLIFWHSDGVTSLNPETGEEFWFIKFPEEANPSVTTITTPCLAGNLLLISEFYKGSIMIEISSNPPAGEEVWRSHETDPGNETALNSLMSSLVHRDGYAYGVTGMGDFRCIEIESGEMQWNRSNWMNPDEEKPVIFATAFLFENGERYFLFNDIGELMIVRLYPEGMEEVSRAAILEPTSLARGRSVVWSHPAYASGMMFVRNDKEIVCVDLRQTEK